MTELPPQESQERGPDTERSRRPGVPMEAEPAPAAGVHWLEPERQIPAAPVFMHVGREELPAVFGTAQPPHGLSGIVRRWAYRIPEHRTRHWVLLLLADRIDVLESAARDVGRRHPIWTALGVLGFAGLGTALAANRRR